MARHKPAFLGGIFLAVMWLVLNAPAPVSPATAVAQPVDKSGSQASSGDSPPQDNWWAIRPLTRPRLPEVKDTAWPVTPIDWFILSVLESKGMRPAPPIDRVGF